jgi:hypothetical protein
MPMGTAKRAGTPAMVGVKSGGGKDIVETIGISASGGIEVQRIGGEDWKLVFVRENLGHERRGRLGETISWDGDGSQVVSVVAVDADIRRGWWLLSVVTRGKERTWTVASPPAAP